MASGPNTIERMRAYQRATGLKSVGTHPPVADKLLRHVTHRCVQCGGLGSVMTPKAQLRLRGRVEEKSPDAGEEWELQTIGLWSG
jgi:hypothetical protein